MSVDDQRVEVMGRAAIGSDREGGGLVNLAGEPFHGVGDLGLHDAAVGGRACRRAGQEDLDQSGPEVRSETQVHKSSITDSWGTPRLRLA